MVREEKYIIDLIEQVKSGDRKAENELLEHYSSDIERIAEKYSKTIKDIPLEDLEQEARIVMMEVILKYDYNKGVLFKTFLMKCISNKFTDYYNSEKNRKEKIGEYDYIDQDAEVIDLRETSNIYKEEDDKAQKIDRENEIKEHLKQLNKDERKFYKLREIDKKTDREIAEELGISINMVTKQRKKIDFKIRKHTIYSKKF
jgi:RNA polymerase sigma factor (sigma-70 family)